MKYEALDIRGITSNYLECLLVASGNCTNLNAFDKAFRSTAGPQWPDRICESAPHYSLHGLCPVPAFIVEQGYMAAGKSWCSDYWGSDDDLLDIKVIRVLGQRRYRFFARGRAPAHIILNVSHEHPGVRFQMSIFNPDEVNLRIHKIHDGYVESITYPRPDEAFPRLRSELGFSE